MIRDLIPWGRKDEPSAAARKGSDLFSELHGEMNRLFERFFEDFDGKLPEKGTFGTSLGKGLMNPRFEVTENGNSIEITAELPGVEEKELDVSLDENILTIRGEKKAEKKEEKKHYHISEISYGQFQRSIPLPSGIDREKIRADFKKGVLRISIPKTEEEKAKSKKIKISSE